MRSFTDFVPQNSESRGSGITVRVYYCLFLVSKMSAGANGKRQNSNRNGFFILFAYKSAACDIIFKLQ